LQCIREFSFIRLDHWAMISALFTVCRFLPRKIHCCRRSYFSTKCALPIVAHLHRCRAYCAVDLPIIYAIFRLSISPLRFGTAVVAEQFKDLVPELDRAFLVRNLFDNADRFFRQTGKLVNLSLDTQLDIFHFTYPVPIKGNSSRNIYTIHDLMPLRLPFATMDNKKTYLKITEESDKKC
jgi:hypothetical protein